MQSANTYPLITVADLPACRNFYVEKLGMTVVFEATWVVMLARGESLPICLGLMSPDHPSRPPGPEPFTGVGMILTIELEDARVAHETLTRLGAPVPYGIHEEAWGQRRFMTRDPAGTLIDVVEQIEPAEGFWEKHLSA